MPTFKKTAAFMLLLVATSAVHADEKQAFYPLSTTRLLTIADKGILGSLPVYGQYVKDTEYSLCYLSVWGGSNNGGPAMTLVPCSAVEK